MEIVLTIILILVSLFVLIKGADYLVRGASGLAHWLKVSPILVGLTVVAFGTSLPEFVVSLFSVLGGKADISLGNIIGSNIANIGLVLGFCSILTVLNVKSKTLTHEFPFMIVSTFLLLILATDHFIFATDKFSLGRVDGIIFLTMFIIFLYYIYLAMRQEQTGSVKQFKANMPKKNPVWKDVVNILGGIIGLVVGGKLFTTYATEIAMLIGASEAFIGLSIAALGTSLPELATSGVAAWKKHGDLAIGNIVGSNIFNILFVLGTVSLIKPFEVNPGVLAIDGMVMLAVTLLFLIFATSVKKIYRWEGIVLLLSYLAYFVFLVVRL
jgi:cation:H+ antiporter